MAIQMRRGNYGKFDPDKLLPGEYAVVQGDDPSARDGRSVYMAFAAGVVKRLATYEDMVENVSSALVDAIGDAAERLTERAEAINAAAEEGEAGRREAEAARAAAESARATAEEGRAKAERGRVAADADRETRQAKNDADQAQNNAAAMGMTYHVCPSSEYELDQVDGLHNVPTVAGKPGTMYLTPRVDGATGEDRYDQWLLVDGSWELMGETGSHIEPVTTDDVDAITSGGSVTADRYLNATGLTYWWAKARAALSSLFAAKSHTHAASAIVSGTIAPAQLPLATASAAGAVTVGDGLSVSDGMLSVDNAAYVKLANSSFADDNQSYGLFLFKWGPLRIVQCQFMTVAAGGTVLGKLPGGEVPRGKVPAVGYLYIQGVSGTNGHLRVSETGEIAAWLPSQSEYCSGQVAFLV